MVPRARQKARCSRDEVKDHETRLSHVIGMCLLWLQGREAEGQQGLHTLWPVTWEEREWGQECRQPWALQGPSPAHRFWMTGSTDQRIHLCCFVVIMCYSSENEYIYLDSVCMCVHVCVCACVYLKQRYRLCDDSTENLIQRWLEKMSSPEKVWSPAGIRTRFFCSAFFFSWF